MIVLLLLFSVVTLMGKSYFQTGLIWLAVLMAAWWPPSWTASLGKTRTVILRSATVVVMLVIAFVAFRPEPRTSIYLTESLHTQLMGIYDRQLERWPEDTREIDIETDYGMVHVLECGDPGNPPLVMIHAASMGAHSWAENLEPLTGHFRIYSIDNIGEGNKSELNDALVFPDDQQKVGEHLKQVLDELGIEKAVLFGASNGGFVAQSFASMYPERVIAMALFGPMGLTPLSGKSIMMLALPTMYPFQFIRDFVREWALGTDPYVTDAYSDWFNCIMEGTIPSVAQPVPMTEEQKMKMDFPVLLFLGNEDPIVGDARIASEAAEIFPDIRIEVYDSGHLVNVEKRNEVNQVLSEFLLEDLIL